MDVIDPQLNEDDPEQTVNLESQPGPINELD
jgi:hypothetical protein